MVNNASCETLAVTTLVIYSTSIPAEGTTADKEKVEDDVKDVDVIGKNQDHNNSKFREAGCQDLEQDRDF